MLSRCSFVPTDCPVIFLGLIKRTTATRRIIPTPLNLNTRWNNTTLKPIRIDISSWVIGKTLPAELRRSGKDCTDGFKNGKLWPKVVRKTDPVWLHITTSWVAVLTLRRKTEALGQVSFNGFWLLLDWLHPYHRTV